MVIRMTSLTSVPNADESMPMNGRSGHSESDRADDLVQRLNATGRQSTAEMLQELRRAFPDSPLAVRVRALEALRKR